MLASPLLTSLSDASAVTGLMLVKALLAAGGTTRVSGQVSRHDSSQTSPQPHHAEDGNIVIESLQQVIPKALQTFSPRHDGKSSSQNDAQRPNNHAQASHAVDADIIEDAPSPGLLFGPDFSPSTSPETVPPGRPVKDTAASQLSPAERTGIRQQEHSRYSGQDVLQASQLEVQSSHVKQQAPLEHPEDQIDAPGRSERLPIKQATSVSSIKESLKPLKRKERPDDESRSKSSYPQNLEKGPVKQHGQLSGGSASELGVKRAKTNEGVPVLQKRAPTVQKQTLHTLREFADWTAPAVEQCLKEFR